MKDSVRDLLLVMVISTCALEGVSGRCLNGEEPVTLDLNSKEDKKLYAFCQSAILKQRGLAALLLPAQQTSGW